MDIGQLENLERVGEWLANLERVAERLVNQERVTERWFADYIANGLFSESFGLPEMCWRAPVHLDIFHVIILCETDLLFNKLY